MSQRDLMNTLSNSSVAGTSTDILIVGAGIFGTAAALALRKRGYRVAVLNAGHVLHPLAESTDISKIVRFQYGSDEQYTIMAEEALKGWRQWNKEWNEPLFHEIGVTMVTRQPMSPGGFEYESYVMAQKRGHALERLNADEIVRRFPAWKPGAYVDGFTHHEGGYAESGRVVQKLAALGEERGITYAFGCTVDRLIEKGGRIVGVQMREGESFYAEHTLICAGAWTPIIVPDLAPMMKATGQPVFHLKPATPALFTPPQLTIWCADISATGWYGFPMHVSSRVLKVGNHGAGMPLHPENDARYVPIEMEGELRTMLVNTFPALMNAEIIYRRCCVYSDTLDEHFLIDRHPERPGLTVAAGGSGHGFKFAPILGDLIADALEGKPNEWLPKFRWRILNPDTVGQEAARNHG
jgi:glycine/D-amino acid oxidase-like deaminating enzyme